jgi:hypothetical protein
MTPYRSNLSCTPAHRLLPKTEAVPFCIRARLLVGPQMIKNTSGFRVCVRTEKKPQIFPLRYDPLVIPRACDFFDLFVFSAYPTSCISSPRQSRHPERSASQIYRKQRALWRGVEEPVLSEAEGTPAMLISRCSREPSGRKLQRKIKKSQTPSEAEGSAVRPLATHASGSSKIVISTGAHPDFLPRSTGQGRVCAFL